MSRPQPVLSFEEALEVLHSMFTDWPKPALSEMLQANDLNMERCVEAILTVGTAPPGLTRGHAHASVPDARALRSPAGPSSARSTSSQYAEPQSERRGHFVKLPEDFLRVPGCKSVSEQQQLALDEQLAIMLQDEMFLQQLQRDMPELAHGGRGAGAPQHLTGGRARSNSGDESVAHLRKSIGDMGDQVKKRITHLYSRWVKNRDGARDNSHVPLMNAPDDDDVSTDFSLCCGAPSHDHDDDLSQLRLVERCCVSDAIIHAPLYVVHPQGEVLLFNPEAASGRTGGSSHSASHRQEYEMGHMMRSSPHAHAAAGLPPVDEDEVVIDTSLREERRKLV